MTNLEILKATKAKIENEENWTKGVRHRNGAYCPLGALDAVLGHQSDAHPVVALLAESLTTAERARHSDGSYDDDHAGTVAKFNNNSEHREVIAWFDRTIERQRIVSKMLSAPVAVYEPA